MVLTYHGKACVKASLGALAIAFNPIGKDSDMKAPRFGADIVLISTSRAEYNGADQMSYGDRTPFVASGPGEYEVSDIFIRGLATTGADGSPNTIYVLSLDDMKIVHLGALADSNLSPEVLEALGDVDVLLAPVFDETALGAAEIHKLATRLNPKVVLPLGVATERKDLTSAFLKAAGEEGIAPVDKYTIKKKDIEALEGEMVVLGVA